MFVLGKHDDKLLASTSILVEDHLLNDHYLVTDDYLVTDERGCVFDPFDRKQLRVMDSVELQVDSVAVFDNWYVVVGYDSDMKKVILHYDSNYSFVSREMDNCVVVFPKTDPHWYVRMYDDRIVVCSLVGRKTMMVAAKRIDILSDKIFVVLFGGVDSVVYGFDNGGNDNLVEIARLPSFCKPLYKNNNGEHVFICCSKCFREDVSWFHHCHMHCCIEIHRIKEKEENKCSRLQIQRSTSGDCPILFLHPMKDYFVYMTGSVICAYSWDLSKHLMLDRDFSTVSDLVCVPASNKFFIIDNDKIIVCDVPNPESVIATIRICQTITSRHKSKYTPLFLSNKFDEYIKFIMYVGSKSIGFIYHLATGKISILNGQIQQYTEITKYANYQLDYGGEYMQVFDFMRNHCLTIQYECNIRQFKQNKNLLAVELYRRSPSTQICVFANKSRQQDCATWQSIIADPSNTYFSWLPRDMLAEISTYFIDHYSQLQLIQ